MAFGCSVIYCPIIFLGGALSIFDKMFIILVNTSDRAKRSKKVNKSARKKLFSA